ncbi:hypothetical protein [Streptococcus plurextorum]
MKNVSKEEKQLKKTQSCPDEQQVVSHLATKQKPAKNSLPPKGEKSSFNLSPLG